MGSKAVAATIEATIEAGRQWPRVGRSAEQAEGTNQERSAPARAARPRGRAQSNSTQTAAAARCRVQGGMSYVRVNGTGWGGPAGRCSACMAVSVMHGASGAVSCSACMLALPGAAALA